MQNRYFRWVLAGILLFGFALRMVPLSTGTFYFTTDQGRDAVQVREMLAGRLWPLVGPETSVAGVHHGALWYYFTALGFFLFNGHPFGAVFLLVLLNLGAVWVVARFFRQRLSPAWAAASAALLAFSWGFYDTSRYAFNPFPLAALTLTMLVNLLRAGEGQKAAYLWAGAAAGAAFHAHSVAALPIFFWFITVGILYCLQRRTTFLQFISGLGVAMLFLLPHGIYEVANGFPEVHAVRSEFSKSAGFFAGSGGAFAAEFVNIAGGSIIPQVPPVGAVLLLAGFGMLLFPFSTGKKPAGLLPRQAAFLILLLLLATYGWYAVNSTWKPWQTVYISPLLLVVFLLGTYRLPKLPALVMVCLLFLVQVQYLWYRLATDDRSDASLLKNELASIEWIYQKSGGSGFSVYTYDPSVLDYTYQYLLPWYGKRAYGYLPCEYASYPGSPKVFLPGSSHWREPAKPCTGLRFLIIEPDTVHPDLARRWLADLHQGVKVQETYAAGSIAVEMTNAY